jgi:hypothetical protein
MWSISGYGHSRGLIMLSQTPQHFGMSELASLSIKIGSSI